ncbi:hypothetical protein DW683_03795 [Bacteroides sp. AM25-34]|jgi:hypothetical protein|nr:hypothetical protein DW267_06645 [Bacteroides sp. AM22-3LB]RGF18778.1 hypothetical protein DW175_07015 [Bacteroides sp. AM16-15]RGI05326.1 hypothetical protein DW683_03795 [Bacteroides sp. AM25-34]
MICHLLFQGNNRYNKKKRKDLLLPLFLRKKIKVFFENSSGFLKNLKVFFENLKVFLKDSSTFFSSPLF